jgi:hypothetical protein
MEEVEGNNVDNKAADDDDAEYNAKRMNSGISTDHNGPAGHHLSARFTFQAL